MRIQKITISVFAVLVALSIVDSPSEAIASSIHAPGLTPRATCPETLVCPTYNGGSNMRSVHKACDAQGDTTSITCTYWNSTVVVLTPSSTKCNECTVNTSQGVATCGQTTLTTYANASCQSG